MRSRTVSSLALAALLASGCGAPEDPQLAMCQALAKQLTGDTVSGWGEVHQNEGSRARDVSIAFERSGGGGGSIDCRYPIDRQSGAIATAPDQVTLDGERVPTGTLLSAGVKASSEIIAGTAAETAAQTRVLAEEAGDKARELAEEASVLAGEAGEKARELAEEARDIAAEGAKALQETLER